MNYLKCLSLNMILFISHCAVQSSPVPHEEKCRCTQEQTINKPYSAEFPGGGYVPSPDRSRNGNATQSPKPTRPGAQLPLNKDKR